MRHTLLIIPLALCPLFYIFYKRFDSDVLHRPFLTVKQSLWTNSSYCSLLSYELIGHCPIQNLPTHLNYVALTVKENPLVSEGGYFSPKICDSNEKPRNRTAILIPYRNRWEHLSRFLRHMHPILRRQKLEYKIYVITQAGNDPFNRGKLLNIGFEYAMKEKDWDCIFLHDVDFLPENDQNLYICSDMPRRMNVLANVWKYKYGAPYGGYFGGVSSIKPSQYRMINGFYNDYFGWGAEDDDLKSRIRKKGLKITMYNAVEAQKYGRYTMLSHKPAKPAPERYAILKNATLNADVNGLNNLKYGLLAVTKERLFTNITVDVLYDEKAKALKKKYGGK